MLIWTDICLILKWKETKVNEIIKVLRNKGLFDAARVFDRFSSGLATNNLIKSNIVLGRGAEGTVYLGQFGNKNVAVKDVPDLNPKQIERTEEEIQLMVQYEHPNILRYLGCKPETDRILIVLEYCEKSLQEWIETQEPVSISKDQILLESSTGLEFLHTQKVIHGDLKPQNILLAKKMNRWVVKIADFGMSKFALGDSSGVTITKSSLGTPGWMAPEILRYIDEKYPKTNEDVNMEKMKKVTVLLLIIF